MVTRRRNPGREDDVLRALGAAVRARRRALGMTQADLAAGAALSVPFVSQVETGFASPSLMSLFTIARVLDTTPERLLAGPPAEQVTLVRAGEGHLYDVTDAPATARRRQLTALDEPFSGAVYEVAPGEDLGGYAASQGRELLHVLTGRLIVDLELEDGEVSHELGAGDTLVYSTSLTHRWRHAGRATARFLHVVSAAGRRP